MPQTRAIYQKKQRKQMKPNNLKIYTQQLSNLYSAIIKSILSGYRAGRDLKQKSSYKCYMFYEKRGKKNPICILYLLSLLSLIQGAGLLNAPPSMPLGLNIQSKGALNG